MQPEDSLQRKELLLRLLMVAVLLAITLLPRASALDRFATVDEAKWMLRSGNFFQALYARDYLHTFQSEHPGVTVTWAGTAGLVTRFRGYAGLSGRQMPGPTGFQRFLREQGQEPAELLAGGRYFIILGFAAAVILAFWAAQRLIGWLPAWLGFALLSGDPFTIAHTRLLHLDGTLSILMLVSVLWYLDYLFLGRKRASLAVSAAAAGLSWLTKSPGFFLIPFFGLISILASWRGAERERMLMTTGRSFIAWLVIAGAVFVLFWPAMWVDPFGSLGRVVEGALGYTLEGNQNTSFFNGVLYGPGESAWYYYPLAWLWRSTPVVTGGLIAAAISLLMRSPGSIPDSHKRFAAVLGLYALSFGFMVSLAGQKYDRYLLPAMLALILLAGLGWYWGLDSLREWLRRRREAAPAALLIASAIVVLLSGQLWGAFDTTPYYLQYFNPLLGGLQGAQDVFQIGWGEGLDQAARYLNSQADSKRLRVVSWYGDAPFGYFFDGITINMAADAALEDLLEADYIVLYYEQAQRRLPSSRVLDYFASFEPEYSVTINGVPYAWVFNRDDLPDR